MWRPMTGHDGRERPAVARREAELGAASGARRGSRRPSRRRPRHPGSAAMRGRPDGHGRHLAAGDDLGAGRRVEADDGAARPVGAEQRQLRLEVLAHVGVVVEVVVGEVGEAGDVEDEPVDAAPAERLRAHLDGDGLDAALAHEREEGVHLVRLGGREPRDDHLARDVALGGGREAGRRRRAGRGCPRAGARRSSCRWCRSVRTGSAGRRRGPVP